MPQRLSLWFLTLASPLVLVTFVVRGEAALWLFSFLTMAFPVALIVLAVSARPGWSALAPWLAVLFAVLQIGGFGILFFSGKPDRVEPWFWGLPPAAVFMLLGLWLAPLLIVCWAYPATFHQAVLERGDRARLRKNESGFRASGGTPST